MATSNHWRPYWVQTYGSAWERAKAALHRDWEQTKRDLHLGGHELNQSLKDTVMQVAGKQRIPAYDRANPPKMYGQLDTTQPPRPHLPMFFWSVLERISRRR